MTDVPSPSVGLCAGCANVREIRTRTGSRFFLCELSAVDPAFPRYPPLPVLRCRGFVPAEEDPLDAGGHGPGPGAARTGSEGPVAEASTQGVDPSPSGR